MIKKILFKYKDVGMKRKIALLAVFLVIVILHAVFQVGIFLNLSRIPGWDTFFFFPSFFYFTAASLFTVGQIPWWSPISQNGIPLYYLLITTYPPFFPTTIVTLALSAINNIFGLGVSFYQIYITQQLLINPALIVLLALLISSRLFKHLLTIVFVTSMVAFYSSIQYTRYNTLYITVAIMNLLLIYALLFHYQRQTFGSKIFLSLVLVFFALNFFSMYTLYLLMYSIPLFIIGFVAFHYRSSLFVLKKFLHSFNFNNSTIVFFILAIISAFFASWLVVDFNVESLVRNTPLYGYDPLVWEQLGSSPSHLQPILPTVVKMFIDSGGVDGSGMYTGIATLPFLIYGLLTGKGRLRFVFFLTFLGILFFINANVVYVIFTNAIGELGKNRHLGEIMGFGAAHFALFSAGFGIEAILKQHDDKESRRFTRIIAILLLAVIAFYLFESGQLKSNVYIWVAIACIAILTYFKGKNIKLLVNISILIIMIFTVAQLIDYNNIYKYLPSQEVSFTSRHPHFQQPPRFIEKGWNLQFKQTGSYILDNSILGNSQGYMFGDDIGIPSFNYTHPQFNYFGPRQLTVLRNNLPDWKLMQIVSDANNRIRFPEKVYFAATEDEALKLLKKEDDPLMSIAVLIVNSPNEKMPIIIAPSINSSDNVKIENFGFNKLELIVNSDTERLLYYADGYDRFWYAQVNGKPTEIYRANIIHKAIKIPKGESKIVFEFNPWPVKVLYALTLLFTISFLYYSWKIRESKKEPV